MRKIIFILSLSLIVVSCQQKQDHNLKIAVAANMQFAIKELAKKFTLQTGIKCDLIISSSGKLTAQIKEGAPFDIFISADMKYPTELYNAGFTAGKPKIYGYGKLVLWSMIDTLEPSIDILKNSKIRHIAIANPKTAPYGKATIETLKHYGIYESVKDKLVYGESISQTNQFIVSKSAGIGFTSKSVVLSPQIKEKGKWIAINETVHTSISQGVIILKSNVVRKNEAKKFYDFISSIAARKILRDFGYSVTSN
ncbi:molybdate ABC transporter substrate-binding protein [Aquimarina sediminis]|uniref:molybdate ABC transporter substrate-binding protein n=1 Tax=Aquimarina sediminis TaxID=2070536 RepID=UPI000CA08000|nr:molybdate ABC transporter substrate-binding protein [Aquimarina sediminis]